jgi:hypothetical protein
MFLKGEREMKKHWRPAFYIICTLIVLSSVACKSSLTKNYGKISLDRHASKTFESYQVNPSYNYYISGSDVHPNAIMGLDKAYILESDLWKQVDMTPQKLRELVIDMQNKVRSVDIRLALHGFAVFDNKDKQIGVWYSILAATTSLMMKDDYTVVVITPDIGTYLRYDNR